MSSAVPVNGQQGDSVLGRLSPQLCWQYLQDQLGPFSVGVITIGAHDYNALTQQTRDFLVQMYMNHTQTQNARYVRDAAGGRVYLGAPERLFTQHAVILDLPGSDLPVMFHGASAWTNPNNAQNQANITHTPPQHHHQQQQQQQMINQYGAPPSYLMPGTVPLNTAPHVNSSPISMGYVSPREATPSTSGSASQSPEKAPQTFVAAPRTPEQQNETPTKPSSSRKRKSTSKTSGPRKRNTSNASIKRSDSDDGNGDLGPSSSHNVGVNLARLPELTGGVSTHGKSQTAKD
ncbi:hypothetical protein G7054_g9745 [Neopestalotiopsis clavispora]|nr:hypothetical protein G7054_g9745 [Neopestalotiopsis clavispora]